MQDTQLFLEMMERPAFTVRDGIVQYANQYAKRRLIQVGESILPRLEGCMQEYEALRDGCLYLTLDFGTFTCGASVTRHETEDIFLMDRDQDLIQLQTLALAGQQLRMPISNLMQLTDALQANFREETTEKEIVSQINRGLYQMFRIVSNMTDAERYASNCLTNLQTTHATNYLKEVFAGAEAMLEGTAVTLRYEGPSKNVFTLIDRAQLERAILNMLSNALKFAPKDSVINAKAEVYDKQLRISVENQGEPIPPHIQSSIFHRYQREPSVEDSRYGLGLGMTVIRSVAAIHGGTVLVDHSNGTRVTMTIAIRRQIPSELRSPVLHVSDYAGGWDKALVELADTLPVSKYKK